MDGELARAREEQADDLPRRDLGLATVQQADVTGPNVLEINQHLVFSPGVSKVRSQTLTERRRLPQWIAGFAPDAPLEVEMVLRERLTQPYFPPARSMMLPVT